MAYGGEGGKGFLQGGVGGIAVVNNVIGGFGGGADSSNFTTTKKKLIDVYIVIEVKEDLLLLIGLTAIAMSP